MDNTYVSKDNGLTWTKRVGNSLTRSVYGGKFVDVGTSLSLITKRNQRTDGSSISPDVITIGQEGATTVIGGTTTNIGGTGTTTNIGGTGSTTNIGGRASILQGDTSNHLTFSRNGNFTVGIGPEANPKLIMGASTNTVYIPGALDVSGRVGLSEPITIGYTIPTSNNQLGYYARSTFTGTNLNVMSGASYCPLGPLVPGLYQANVFISIVANYQFPNFNFDVLGRTTPFVENITVTGENIVYDKDGLHWNGYRTPDFTYTGNLDFNISGFINLKPTDVLQGVTVSYFCVRVNCQIYPVDLNRVNFSVVRIG